MSGTRGGSNDAALPLIATEEVGGEQYQRVKLVSGTAGETAAVGASAANGLEVDVTRVQGTVTVDASGAAVPVTDNGGSLTVDGAVAISGTAFVRGGETHDSPPAGGIVPIGGIAHSAIPAAVNEGDAVAAYMDLYGIQQVAVQSVAGQLLVKGQVAEGFPVTGTNPVLAAGRASNVAPVAVDQGDVVFARYRLDGAQTVYVEDGSITAEMVGQVAHGSPATAVDPVLVGGYASDSAPTEVEDGDAVRAWFKRNGAQAVYVSSGSLSATLSGISRVESYESYAQRFDVAADTDSVSISSGNYAGSTTIYNDSASALYLDLTNGTCTTSSFSVKIAAGGYYEVPFGFRGAISGCWDSATGYARVTWTSAIGWD